MQYLLFTFNKTKNSLIASNLLGELCTTMPILREISADCGVALKVSVENLEKSTSIIENNFDKEDFKIYEITGFGKSKSITIIR